MLQGTIDRVRKDIAQNAGQYLNEALAARDVRLPKQAQQQTADILEQALSNILNNPQSQTTSEQAAIDALNQFGAPGKNELEQVIGDNIGEEPSPAYVAPEDEREAEPSDEAATSPEAAQGNLAPTEEAKTEEPAEQAPPAPQKPPEDAIIPENEVAAAQQDLDQLVEGFENEIEEPEETPEKKEESEKTNQQQEAGPQAGKKTKQKAKTRFQQKTSKVQKAADRMIKRLQKRQRDLNRIKRLLQATKLALQAAIWAARATYVFVVVILGIALVIASILALAGVGAAAIPFIMEGFQTASTTYKEVVGPLKKAVKAIEKQIKTIDTISKQINIAIQKIQRVTNSKLSQAKRELTRSIRGRGKVRGQTQVGSNPAPSTQNLAS